MPDSQTNSAGDLVLELAGQDGGALHLRLKRALRAAIRTGRVTVGSALPPSRQLATDLGCSRWAVTEAYAQLVAEGYLEARTGSATRVRWSGDTGDGGHAGEVSRHSLAPRVDLTPGLPDLRAFPRQRWSEALRQTAASLPFGELGYPDPAGHPRLRRILADYLTRSRGVYLREAQLLVSTSATDGVRRICRALVASGATRIAVEDPGWTRLHNVARASGLATVPVPVDEHGLDVTALERHPGVRAVITAPAHQFPTGVVLHPDRRAALLAWADRVDGIILEDDYDADFRYDRPPVASLQGMNPGRVLLLGSLSKTLTPALGIGWLVGPNRWTSALLGADVPSTAPPTLDQLAFAALLETGGYDRHLRASRRRYRTRRDALISALGTTLPDAALSGIAAGLHIVLHLPDDVPAATVTRHAAGHGLRLAQLATYQAVSSDAHGLVLGYGNLADNAVSDAVALLADAVEASRLDPTAASSS